MAAIAKAAGVSVGSIYQYFASKDDVFDAATRRLYANIIELAEPAFSAPHPTMEHLRVVYADIIAEHQRILPAHRFLRRRDRDRGDVYSHPFQQQVIERSVAMTVRAGRATDEASARKIVTDVIRASGGLLSAVLLYEEEDIDQERLVERMVTMTSALAPKV